MDGSGAPASGDATPTQRRPALVAVPSEATPGEDRPPVPKRPSFDEFYRQEYRQVLGLAYVLTGNESVAEDTAQDAFTAAYRQWSSVGGYDSPGAWVRRVVCNRAASVVRRRFREAKALVRLARQTPAPVELEESDAEFWRAVRQLPPRQGQAVALFYLHDYSVREIAEVLDCAEGTVKTHLSRARTAVARRLRLEDDQ